MSPAPPAPGRARPQPGARWRGEQGSAGPIGLAAREVGERLRAIDAWCRRRFTGLVAVNLLATEESHDKQLQSDQGVAARLGIERAALAIEFIGQAADGAPTTTREDIYGGKTVPFVPFPKLEGAKTVGTHNP